MDWKLALKLGGPSVVVTWVFYELMSIYLGESDIFKTSVFLNALFIVAVFSFCLLIGWLVINKRNNALPRVVQENEVTENEVKSDIKVGANAESVTNNKVAKNKVGGNIEIG